MSEQYRTRIAKHELLWFGFRLKPGFVFGTHKGEDYVTNGSIRSTKNGSMIKVWVHTHIDPWEADQTCRGADWFPKWIPTQGDALGEKLLETYLKGRKLGIKPKSSDSGCESYSRHLFASDKSRFDVLAKQSYYYDCHAVNR